MATISELILGHRGGIGGVGAAMLAAANQPQTQEYLALLHHPRSGAEALVAVQAESWARAHEAALRGRQGWTVLEVA